APDTSRADASTRASATDPGDDSEGPEQGNGEVVVHADEFGLELDAHLKATETDFLHTLRLLYQDYLDGSPFHRNDTKASTQLLGILALRNLSLSNLPYYLRGRRRLDRLDLNL